MVYIYIQFNTRYLDETKWENVSKLLTGTVHAAESAALSPRWGSGRRRPRCRWLAEVTEGLGWDKGHCHLPSWFVPPQVKESTASALVVSSGSSSGAAASRQQTVSKGWSREAGRSEPRQWGGTLNPPVEAWPLKETKIKRVEMYHSVINSKRYIASSSLYVKTICFQYNNTKRPCS